MARRSTRPADEVEEDIEMSGSESGDGDDGVYIVEQILSHKTERDGRNRYLIKWEGYPDSENTWENEENIIDKEMLKKYWNEKKAEKPVRPAAKKANSRMQLSVEPEEPEMNVLQVENWEPLVQEIQTVDRHADNVLYVIIQWKSGKTSHHPAPLVYQRCPQKMLQFYETRLRFRNN